VVSELLARGRAAWPGVEVTEAIFAAWANERIVEGEAPLHEDLYLACACAGRDPAALRAFDAAFGEEFAALFKRFGYLATGADDVRQHLYEKLFVGEKPTIAQYAGRGALRTWVRVAITRTLLNRTADRAPREVPAGEELFAALPDPSDPETAHLRKIHGE